MGEQGATGGAWGARDEASWWQSGAGELQQQQMNEEIARSTAANTHQLYTYKMTDGFSNNSTTTDNTPSTNYEYRIMSNSNNRGASTQQTWWYASGSVDAQQNSSPSAQNDSNSESKGNTNQSNGIQVVQQQEQNLQQNQLLQQQNLQQVMQQNQSLQIQQQQQQTLQQMLQQQQQQHQQQLQQQSQQALQQTIQSLSSAQAQALVQAQHVAQTLQHQQQTLQEQIQVVQQQQIQAALQRQSATLQELQQQAQQQALLAQANTPKPRMPRGRPLNKPRGRMTAYAFFVQTCREEHKKKHPDENVVFAAFSKKCAERWNTMSEKEKQRFHDMAEQDKRRYELEMQNYVPPKDVKVGRGRKRHQLKDPNAPKRSLSAFFWFCNDERSKVKGDNPEFTMGDIAKELGRRWAAVDSSCKSKYEALSEQDKARYDREMTAYKKGPLALVTSKPDQQELEEDAVEYEVEEEYK